MPSPKTVKTRFTIISDTHAKQPFPAGNTKHAYRLPLPKADVLIHSGDLTQWGALMEHESTFDVLREANAEIKISAWRGSMKDYDDAVEMWTGKDAKMAGIVYLEEGVRTFELKNGAIFTVYTSPYTPEYCDTAFDYPRDHDRFNPPNPDSKFQAPNPIPSWPGVDIIITHGPPHGILDKVRSGDNAGCVNLFAADKRARPRIHCFGHIHEGWGAERYNWVRKSANPVLTNKTSVLKDGSAQLYLAADGGKLLKFGEETVFINAAIMDQSNNPGHAP
ncbi:MAG: hypothetical protein MMC33_000046 [Icmadophila ericetorum]|nr:hypothetical protein [Icmadophila ericetorum]